MIEEKCTTLIDGLIFQEGCMKFTAVGYQLKIIIDYEFNEPNLSYAEGILGFFT